jgi:hypothetical protein
LFEVFNGEADSVDVFIACIATIAPIGMPSARQAMQTVPPASRHGHWSYRLIDGRKCWYEGKNMLSESLLEWAPAQAIFDGEPARELRDKPGNPLDEKA